MSIKNISGNSEVSGKSETLKITRKYVVLHYTLADVIFMIFFKIPSGYSFLKSKFSNLSYMYGKKYNEQNINVAKSLRIFQLLK